MALRGGGWILLTAVVVLSFSAVNSVSTLDELAGLAPYPEEAQQSALRAELSALKPVGLNRRAIAAGVDSDALEMADDKPAIIELIVQTINQDKENPNEEKTTPTSAQLAPPRSGMPAPKWRTAILRESSGNPDVNLAPNLETPAASESSVESSVANVETSATEVTPTEDDQDGQTVTIAETKTALEIEKYILKWVKECVGGTKTYTSNSAMVAFACPYEDVHLEDGTILAKAGAIYVRYGNELPQRIISDTPRANAKFGRAKFGRGGFFLSGDTLIVRDIPPVRPKSGGKLRSRLPSFPDLMDLVNGESTELLQTAISVKKRGRPVYSVIAPMEQTAEQTAEQMRTAIAEKEARATRKYEKQVKDEPKKQERHLKQLERAKQAILDEILTPLAVELSAFGSSVAFSDDTLVIAALPFADEPLGIRNMLKKQLGYWPQGKVFIQHDGADGELQTWQQSDGCQDCVFGHHVAVSSGQIYVSDPGATVDDVIGAGVVHVRQIPGASSNDGDGTMLAADVRLTSEHPTKYGWFGLQLQVDGNTMVATARDSEEGSEQGVLYIRRGSSDPMDRVVHPFGDNSTTLSKKEISAHDQQFQFGYTRQHGSAVKISDGSVAILVTNELGDSKCEGRGCSCPIRHGRLAIRETTAEYCLLRTTVLYLSQPGAGAELQRHVLEGAIFVGSAFSKKTIFASGPLNPTSLNSWKHYGTYQLGFKDSFIFQDDTIVVPNGSPVGSDRKLGIALMRLYRKGKLPEVTVSEEDGTTTQVPFIGAVFIKRGAAEFERLISSLRGTRDGQETLPFGAKMDMEKPGRLQSAGFGTVVKLNEGMLTIGAPFEDVKGAPLGGAMYMSQATGHKERITAAQPMPDQHFGNSFAFTEGKLFAAGDMPGTGAQMSQNSLANKVFAKLTITNLHAKLPEGMPSTVIASTPSTFMAYGKQRILPLLEAVQRVEELSPSGSLNCSAINQDGALINIFGQWEVNTFQGLTDFSKRVEAVIPGNAWDGGVQIPERRIQFQFLKKEIQLRDEKEMLIGSLNKHMVCSFEAAFKSTECCVGKLLNVTQDKQQQFVAELKMW